MSPWRAAWRDWAVALREFSRPARLLLLASLLAWIGFGINYVLFNLYLVEAGFDEAFVGRAIALNGLGLALAALPAGVIADRWGRRRCLVLGAVLEGLGILVRAVALEPTAIYAGGFIAGAGQGWIAIAAAPFLTEHSTARDRTHLFSAYFAVSLIAGVIGSLIGGWIPAGLSRLPLGLDTFGAYRATLVLSALIGWSSLGPLAAMGLGREAPVRHDPAAGGLPALRLLAPIALNAFLIGAGAGLVIPFMNLYFKTRFQCSSAQIGVFFSIAQVVTAVAALLGPLIARRFGKLRTATASELLSLPFLITLGFERRLDLAVAAFWMRATLMQAATPLIGAFVMEALPPALRARSTSLNSLVWYAGWATSAMLAGALIARFGYEVPFYITAGLYLVASVTFYLRFRGTPETHAEPTPTEAAATPP